MKSMCSLYAIWKTLSKVYIWNINIILYEYIFWIMQTFELKKSIFKQLLENKKVWKDWYWKQSEVWFLREEFDDFLDRNKVVDHTKAKL